MYKTGPNLPSTNQTEDELELYWKNVFTIHSWHFYNEVSSFIQLYINKVLCLCWGFTAQSTQWGHVERGQFT